VHICYCDSEEMAQMVADAVYDYDAKMERLRCEHYADKV
jgi:NAD(P)H-flavin reductase